MSLLVNILLKEYREGACVFMHINNESNINKVNNDQGEIYDVTIIGGGATGLFTAFYSGLRGMKTKVIEASKELGGKVTMGFPDKTISDIGGIKEITGQDLVKELVAQAKTFNPTIVCGQWITEMHHLKDGNFCLTSQTGETHHTRTIILAVGSGIIKPIQLEADGVEHYRHGNLYYAVDDFNQFINKQVVISGGGDSAVDWANALHSIAKSVTVIHRRDEFRAFENSVQKMKEQVNVLTPHTIKSLQGEGNHLTKVSLENLETGKTQHIEVDAVLVNHGFSSELGGIENWGLQTREGQILVNDAMETNIPGIFAAGDVVSYPNKLNLFVAGFTEGPMAINSANKYLNHEPAPMAMYSTHHEKLYELKK